MNARRIWFWLALAATLAAFIITVQRNRPPPQVGAGRILPQLDASAVSSIQVRPSGKMSLGIRAERTNQTWRLVEPLNYAAQGTNIDRLLSALEALTPATYITAAEIRNRPNAEEEFGLVAPQASIIVQQRGYRAHLLVGAFTPPGDQLYLQVVAREGVYVVDAGLLKSIPHSANDWRDPTLLVGDPASVDRLAVTNAPRAFIVQRDTNQLWRMVWPLSSARADNTRIEDALQRIWGLRVRSFVSDDPNPDLDQYGLEQPELEIALSRGSNSAAFLQFGKSVATATNEVYARRATQDSIFTVASDVLGPWRGATVNDFRDPHLLTLTDPLASIEVRGGEAFSVQRQTNDTWQILPGNTPADDVLVGEWISALTNIQILQFAKDVVNPPELPEFGLASPVLNYSLQSASVGPGQPPTTNRLIVELDFGVTTNATDRVFVRRKDESSVYAISTNDFSRLPSANWQLRPRRLWNLAEADLKGVVIEQQGKTREIIRNGDHDWSLAPGSQGIIEDLAVEETVRGLVRASARAWVARGSQDLQRYGLDKPHRVTLLLKSGARISISFGAVASPEAQYAAVQDGGELYVLEFPWFLYRDISNYLSAR